MLNYQRVLFENSIRISWRYSRRQISGHDGMIRLPRRFGNKTIFYILGSAMYQTGHGWPLTTCGKRPGDINSTMWDTSGSHSKWKSRTEAFCRVWDSGDWFLLVPGATATSGWHLHNVCDAFLFCFRFEIWLRGVAFCGNLQNFLRSWSATVPPMSYAQCRLDWTHMQACRVANHID